jgi:hypothetical protein
VDEGRFKKAGIVTGHCFFTQFLWIFGDLAVVDQHEREGMEVGELDGDGHCAIKRRVL